MKLQDLAREYASLMERWKHLKLTSAPAPEAWIKDRERMRVLARRMDLIKFKGVVK